MTLRSLVWVLIGVLGVGVQACAENSNNTRSDASGDVTIDNSITPFFDSGSTSALPGSLLVGKLGSTGNCSHMEVTEASATAGTATLVLDDANAYGCVRVYLDGNGEPTATWGSVENTDNVYYWTYTLSGLKVGSLNITFKYNVTKTNDAACANPADPEGTALSCDVIVTGP